MAVFPHLVDKAPHVCVIAVNTALSRERPSTPMCVPAPWLPCHVTRVCKGPMCAPANSTVHTWCPLGSPMNDPEGLDPIGLAVGLKWVVESLGGFWEMLNSHGEPCVSPCLWEHVVAGIIDRCSTRLPSALVPWCQESYYSMIAATIERC